MSTAPNNQSGQPSAPAEQVGYKKPPKVHQWKKGQSGNPTGKKKAQPAQSIPEAVAKQLMEQVTIMKAGKKKTMQVAEVFAAKLIQGVLAGGPQIQLKALDTFKKNGICDMYSVLRQEVAAEQDNEQDCFTEEHRRLLAIIEEELSGEQNAKEE